MTTNDKYEAELLSGLAQCGGSWETLARELFNMHPRVVEERKAEHERLVGSFLRSNVPLVKRGRKRIYTGEEVLSVIVRLANVKFNKHGQLRYSTRKSALREGLGMQGAKLERWEKILSSIHHLQSWKAPRRPGMLDHLIEMTLD